MRDARDALLWKLEGLPEYDIRSPLTPAGTNPLGLVKHATGTEAVRLGATFGRPFEVPARWITDGAEPNSGLWAAPDETREQIVGLYRRVWFHSDATIGSLDLDTVGEVPGVTVPG